MILKQFIEQLSLNFNYIKIIIKLNLIIYYNEF